MSQYQIILFIVTIYDVPLAIHPSTFSIPPAIPLTRTIIEHDGLRKDGQPDQRVGTGEFAHGKVDPTSAGKEGGQTGGSTGGASSGGSDANQGSAHQGGDGLRKDGQPDQRLKQNQ